MRPIKIKVGPLAAASASNIFSGTPTAGALTLSGALVTAGVARPDVPRQILITTTGNESTRNFKLVGTDWANSPITEVVAGPNVSTGASVLSYKTLTSVTISGNAAGSLTIGTNGIADSPWVRLDQWALPQVSVQTTVSGTVNYTVQQSLDDPNSATDAVAPQSMTWANASDPNLQGATAGVFSSFAYAPIWVRVRLNSGTGSVSANLDQYGVVVR